MDKSEIATLYQQIEDLSPNQINELIERDTPHVLFSKARCISVGASLFGEAIRKPKEHVKSACEKEIRKNRSTIKDIIRKHPKSKDYIFEIIMLLAPAIAQQYTGFSGMAIVGTLTIICKQGINAYIA